MLLSIIIPCYNEAQNLPILIERCKKVYTRKDVEVIFVDNGSTDSTPDVLTTLLKDESILKSIRVDVNKGYGFGILAGLRESKGKILGWTHADMQTDPYDCLRAIECFERHSTPDKLFLKGARQQRPLMDVIFTLGMSIFETILLRKGLWDINAQPTLFHRDFFSSWQSPPEDFSLDLYSYYKAKHQKLNITRIPVIFGERAFGQSHWNINWKEKFKFIKRTLDYSLTIRR